MSGAPSKYNTFDEKADLGLHGGEKLEAVYQYLSAWDC